MLLTSEMTVGHSKKNTGDKACCIFLLALIGKIFPLPEKKFQVAAKSVKHNQKFIDLNKFLSQNSQPFQGEVTRRFQGSFQIHKPSFTIRCNTD